MAIYISSLKPVIYLRNPANELLWYRHEGQVDGTFRWAPTSGNVVGRDWNAKHVFPGDDGALYIVNPANELLWYKHLGTTAGTFEWWPTSGRRVGTDWDVKHVFSGGNGIIYSIDNANQLRWFRHDGRLYGTAEWAPNSGAVVGLDWNAKHVFSGGNGVIYVVNAANQLRWYRHEGRMDGTFRWAPGSWAVVGLDWNFRHLMARDNGIIYSINSANELRWWSHEGPGGRDLPLGAGLRGRGRPRLVPNADRASAQHADVPCAGCHARELDAELQRQLPDAGGLQPRRARPWAEIRRGPQAVRSRAPRAGPQDHAHLPADQLRALRMRPGGGGRSSPFDLFSGGGATC